MVAYDDESFISVTSTKKLENDWNELNFYSKNKQKVADMSKEKLLSIIKPIKNQ